MLGKPLTPFKYFFKYINIIISTLYPKNLFLSLNFKINLMVVHILIQKKMILFNNLILVNINYIVLVKVVG